MTEREIINDVINDITWVIENGYIANSYGLKDIEESLNMAIKILGRQEQYRWHDLRKNPEDLPKYLEIVEVCYEYYHYKADAVLPEYGHAYYDDNVKCWGGEASNGSRLRILAWRYIEPFEEDEE